MLPKNIVSFSIEFEFKSYGFFLKKAIQFITSLYIIFISYQIICFTF